MHIVQSLAQSGPLREHINVMVITDALINNLKHDFTLADFHPADCLDADRCIQYVGL